MKNRQLPILLVVFALISLSCKTLSFRANPGIEPPAITGTASAGGNNDDQLVAPTMDWLLFLGTESVPTDMVQDSHGNNYILVTARTDASNKNYNYRNLFLIKISSNGNKEWEIPITEKYTGAIGSLAIDYSGNVYIAGSTGKTWGAPNNPFVANGELGNDVFVAKINSAGGIVWNTFVGDSGTTNIAIDTQGYLYLVKFDAFNTVKKSEYSVIKLDGNGNVVFDTKISGLTSAYPYLLTVGPDGNIYIAGHYRASIDSNSDCFLVKLSSDGALVWNTLIGGPGEEDIAGTYVALQVDKNGNTYFIGRGNATWGTPIAPYDGGYVMDDPDYEWLNGYENFIAKIDNQGTLIWHTFLNKSVWIYSSLLNQNGNLYFSGYSSAGWGNPINKHTSNNADDGFIALMDTNSGAIIWNTFVGGEGNDFVGTIVLLNNDQIYMTGGTDLAFGNPINQFTNDGKIDYFIARISSQ